MVLHLGCLMWMDVVDVLVADQAPIAEALATNVDESDSEMAASDESDDDI